MVEEPPLIGFLIKAFQIERGAFIGDSEELPFIDHQTGRCEQSRSILRSYSFLLTLNNIKNRISMYLLKPFTLFKCKRQSTSNSIRPFSALIAKVSASSSASLTTIDPSPALFQKVCQISFLAAAIQIRVMKREVNPTFKRRIDIPNPIRRHNRDSLKIFQLSQEYQTILGK